MALASLADVKTILGISGTSEDAKLTIMLNVADAEIKRYCGRDFEVGTYGGSSPSAVTNGIGDSGYYSGDNSRYLLLRQRPVTTLTSIYEDPTGRFGDNPDGAFASATLLTAGTDYVLRWDNTLPGSTTRCSNCGIVERLRGVWPAVWSYAAGSINPQLTTGMGNIKVTYTAGYSSVPYDLQYATALLVAYFRRSARFGGRSPESEHFEDYGYSLPHSRANASVVQQVGEVNQLLARWRDVYL